MPGSLSPGIFASAVTASVSISKSARYQHRGVEQALRGGPDKRSVHLAETIAGDTTAGHATAYCQLVERCPPPLARRGRSPCAPSRWSWNASPTISAIWARWRAMWLSPGGGLLRRLRGTC